MPSYSHSRYNILVDETFARVKELSTLKGGEYSGDTDRLLNFRRNAERLGLNKETVWAVYAAKHWDALMQYIQDLEAGNGRKRMEEISGRARDLIVYLILFLAMEDERNYTFEVEEKPSLTGEQIKNMIYGSNPIGKPYEPV